MQVELVQNVMLQGREAWRQMVVLTQQLVLPGRWESATAEVEKFHTNMQQFAVKNAEFIAAQALQQTRVKERDAIAKERTDMLLAYAEFSSVSQALAQALRAQGDTSRGAAEFIRQASIRQALISKLQNACRLMARYEAGKWHLEILKANTQRMDLNTQVVMASELARGRVDLLEKREVELASLVVHHHPRPVAPAPPLLMRPIQMICKTREAGLYKLLDELLDQNVAMQTRVVADDGSALLPNLDAFNFAKTHISAVLASGLLVMAAELRMSWWVKLHVELVVAYTLTRGVRLGPEGLEKLPHAPQPADESYSRLHDSTAVTCAVHHAWHLATALECGLWRRLGKTSLIQTANDNVALRAFFARQYEPKLDALCRRVHQSNVGVLAAAGLTERLHAAALHSIPIDHAKLMSALINEACRTSKPPPVTAPVAKPRPESTPPVTAPVAEPPTPPPGKPHGQPEQMVVELDDSEDESPSPTAAAAGAAVATASAMELRRMPSAVPGVPDVPRVVPGVPDDVPGVPNAPHAVPGVPDEPSARRLALVLLKHRRPCIDYLLSMHQRGSRYQVGSTALLVRLTLEDLVSTLSGVCELSVDQTVHCLGLAVLNHVEQQQKLEEAALNHVKQQQQKKPEEAREAYALKIRQAEAKAEKAKAEKARLATRWAREKAATTAAKTAAKMASETAAQMALETAAQMALETAAKMALEAAEERLWTGSPDSVAGRLLHESTGLVRGSP